MDTSDVSMPSPSKAEKIYEASHSYKGFLIAELRAVFIEIANPDNWKALWRHEVRKADVEKAKAAVHYFHADKATVTAEHGETVEMAGNGLQRWGEK